MITENTLGITTSFVRPPGEKASIYRRPTDLVAPPAAGAAVA